jgi:hypothetical protein
MEHGDVTQRSELKLANDCMRALNQGQQHPLSDSNECVFHCPFKEQRSKKVMLNHTASGFVMDGMAAKEDNNDKRPSKGSTVDSTPNNCRVGGRNGT